MNKKGLTYLVKFVYQLLVKVFVFILGLQEMVDVFWYLVLVKRVLDPGDPRMAPDIFKSVSFDRKWLQQIID